MNISLLILLTYLIQPLRTPDSSFVKADVSGHTYFIAHSASLKSAPSIIRFFKANNIVKENIKEIVSDTADIELAESILESDLEQFMFNKLNKTDTTTDQYRFLAKTYDSLYQTLNTHYRQIKSFTYKNKYYIYVNLFCHLNNTYDADGKGIKNWINASDGWTCYWQILINLTDTKIVSAQHHGRA